MPVLRSLQQEFRRDNRQHAGPPPLTRVARERSKVRDDRYLRGQASPPPGDFKRMTDRRQTDVYLDAMLHILARMSCF